jgi:HPt (histidine-containing phosphotransfer) domain-containing protein
MVEFDTRLADLSERYRASLPIKRANIEQAWHALAGDRIDPLRLENLLRILHRIAGSAPSYGYPEIGRLASELEVRLEALCSGGSLENPSGIPDLAGLLERLLAALAAGERN